MRRHAIHKYEKEESYSIIYLTRKLFSNHLWSNARHSPQ